MRFFFGWLIDWFLDSKGKALWMKDHWVISLLGFLLFIFII